MTPSPAQVLPPGLAVAFGAFGLLLLLPGAREGWRAVVEALSGVGTYDRRCYESRPDEGETVIVRGRVAPNRDPPSARRVGVAITGGGTLVADATPAAAARRALAGAGVPVGVGPFVLAVTVPLSGLP